MAGQTQSMIQNPILPGFNPDPSIVVVGDDFYIATSTFEWYPGVQIHHSKDLENWRLINRPLNREALLDMRGAPDSCGVWAPCLSYSDGFFYLIYTDVKRFDGNFKDTHNYLTTCASIDGQWSDPVYMNASGFDPSLFHDDDGKKWFLNMMWDHRHLKNRFGGILLQEYCPKQRRLIGEIKNIFAGSELGSTEAPHLYKRNGYYYLLTAEGGTFYAHAMTMARAKKIDGPYALDPYGYLLTAKDNQQLPLQRAGHGDLFETRNGESYLVHLCGRPLKGQRRCPLGRETSLQKTYWTDDHWLRTENAVSDGLPALAVSTSNLPAHLWPATAQKHAFDKSQLPVEFQWLRTPFPERFMSLNTRPGHLRLRGKQSIGSLYEQALIARRQQAFVFCAQTKMEFMPTNVQQMAGLICYYNTHKFHYCYVSIDDNGERFVDIMSCLGDPQQCLTFGLREAQVITTVGDSGFTIPHKGPIYLRADVNHDVLTFSFSHDEEEWTTLPIVLDYSILSDEAGADCGASFTGAFVGMACQDVSGQQCPADFDYFSYVEK
jgi:xylan 1,4-beta-xylosidase